MMKVILMRTKVITLCDETWAMAQAKPNFSEWVRSMLLMYDEKKKEEDDKAFKIWRETGEWPEWYS